MLFGPSSAYDGGPMKLRVMNQEHKEQKLRAPEYPQSQSSHSERDSSDSLEPQCQRPPTIPEELASAPKSVP